MALLADALASAIEPVMTHPTEGESLKIWDTEPGSMSLSCRSACQSPLSAPPLNATARPTGTFFCDSTTAQFLPLTPTDVIFAAVIALNAYSGSSKSQQRTSIRFTLDTLILHRLE